MSLRINTYRKTCSNDSKKKCLINLWKIPSNCNIISILHILIDFLELTRYNIRSIVPSNSRNRFSTARFASKTQLIAFVKGANNWTWWNIAPICCRNVQIFGLSWNKKTKLLDSKWKGRKKKKKCFTIGKVGFMDFKA